MELGQRFTVIAFVLLVGGFVLLQVADRDWMKTLSSARVNSSETDETRARGQIQTLESQMSEVRAGSEAASERLRVLARQAIELDRSLKTETKEIETLKAQLENVRVEKKDLLRKIAEGTHDKAPSRRMASTATWDDVIGSLQEFTTKVDHVKLAGKSFFRFVRESAYSPGSVYVNPSGLKMAGILATAARDLGSGQVIIRYDEADLLSRDRALAIGRYMVEFADRAISVQAEDQAGGSPAPKDGVEILVGARGGIE